MKKKKKLLCLCVATMAIASTVIYYGTVSKASGVEDGLPNFEVEEENNYIIIADNSKEYDVIADEFEEDVVDNATDYLEDNKMLVVNVEEGKEDEFLEDNSDLTIEKDYIVMASGRKDKKSFFDFFKRKKTYKDTGREWNLDMVNDVTNKESDKKVKVAIIDSGIDAYACNIEVKERKNFIPGQEELSEFLEDVTGHGTSIASILASDGEDNQIDGMCDNIELYSAKVLDSFNSAPVSRVVEAIYWAIEKKVNIISLSFGTPEYSQALEEAIKIAYDNGILIIAAAGNGGEDGVQYPAAFDEVMAVGSVDSDANISEFSAIGKELELVAPGEKIKATGGFDGTIIVSGTSISVPHVVGAAATVWGKDLSKSNEFVRQLLDVSANSGGTFDEYGNGVVDVSYALDIYDDFENKFVEENRFINEEVVYEIEENDNEIFEYKNNYVEGTWVAEKDNGNYIYTDKNIAGTHSEIINSNKAKYRLTDDEIYLFKRASEIADTFKGTKTAHTNPYFHGFYRKDNGTTEKYNYIAAYIYLTRCAIEGNTINGDVKQNLIKENLSVKLSSPSAMNSINGINDVLHNFEYVVSPQDINKLREQNNNLDILDGDFLVLLVDGNGNEYYRRLYGKMNYTQQNKKIMLWGLAMHTMTDTFAHSTFENNDGKWELMDHKQNKHADDSNVKQNRFKYAKQKAEIVIQRYKNSTKSNRYGENTDFDVPYDSTFRIGMFYDYGSSAGGLKGNYVSRFSKMSHMPMKKDDDNGKIYFYQ